MGLPTWNKDALACLSSRFPYGEEITLEKLNMVDQMENLLAVLNFNNLRARHSKNTVKIEVHPDQVHRFFHDDIRKKIIEKAKNIGYSEVLVDLEGYRQGKLNDGITHKKPNNINELTLLTK